MPDDCFSVSVAYAVEIVPAWRAVVKGVGSLTAMAGSVGFELSTMTKRAGQI